MYKYHTVKCCSKDCEERISFDKLVTQRGLCDTHFKELEEGALIKEACNVKS